MKRRVLELVGVILLFLSFISLFLMFIGIQVFSFIAQRDPASVEKEVNQVLDVRDPVIINKLSETEETREFLMDLPKNTKASGTIDSQGASIITTNEGITLYKVYFVTTINHRAVEVFMYEDKQSRFIYKLFPQWTVCSLRVI